MIADKSCKDFVEVLASDEPTPGGGGASALVAAIGTALGNMVGSLTEGKLKYYEVEDEIEELIDKAEAVEADLLGLIDDDERAFLPLMDAYKMPHNTEIEKAKRFSYLRIVDPVSYGYLAEAVKLLRDAGLPDIQEN